MASQLHNLSSYDAGTVPSSKGMRFGIVVSEYYPEITFALLKGCMDTLQQHGAQQSDLEVAYVPGTFELPTGALLLDEAYDPDAIICIGCVIKGETDHDIYINTAVANSIAELCIHLEKPVIFGVLTPNTMQQAQDRAGGQHGNKGVEAAVAAIKMVALRNQLI
ncbi:MAG: 6,7-dimethyl-8-ribityllumazine synthase [Chitinophagales bacterium]|nr:6,7-dimethyl-8-ribityllumazine synthase [Chitinophagales bacterium]